LFGGRRSGRIENYERFKEYKEYKGYKERRTKVRWSKSDKRGQGVEGRSKESRVSGTGKTDTGDEV